MRTILLRALPYLLVGGFSVYLYGVAGRIEYHHRAGTIGPDFWPKLVLAMTIAVCLYETLRIVLSRGQRSGASGVLQNIVERSEARYGEGYQHVEARSPLLLVAGIALTAVYVWVIQRLGFFLATAPYVAVFIALGGYRRWTLNAATSLLGTLAMMYFFMKVVYVSLPIGGEPFAQVTFALMRLMGIR